MADDFGVEGVGKVEGRRLKAEARDNSGDSFEFPAGAVPVCKRCQLWPAMMNRRTGRPVNGLCGHCRNEITKEKRNAAAEKGLDPGVRRDDGKGNGGGGEKPPVVLPSAAEEGKGERGYLTEDDVLDEFIEKHVQRNEQGRINQKEFLQVFDQWWEETVSTRHAMGHLKLQRLLRRRYPSVSENGMKDFMGIEWRESRNDGNGNGGGGETTEDGGQKGEVDMGGLTEVPRAVEKPPVKSTEHPAAWMMEGLPERAYTMDGKSVDALVAEASELVDEHWRYIEGLLLAHGQPVELVQYHYRTAFLHGFKHGVEAVGKVEGRR